MDPKKFATLPKNWTPVKGANPDIPKNGTTSQPRPSHTRRPSTSGGSTQSSSSSSSRPSLDAGYTQSKSGVASPNIMSPPIARRKTTGATLPRSATMSANAMVASMKTETPPPLIRASTPTPSPSTPAPPTSTSGPSLYITPSYATPTSDRESVHVVVRCRPFLPHETASSTSTSVTIANNAIHIQALNKNKTFQYDRVFDQNATQRQVYEECARPLVEQSLQGYNATVFAYGQTGSGKTHTIMGVLDRADLQGIIPSAVDHIFAHIHATNQANKEAAMAAQEQGSNSYNQITYLLMVSYLEIYNEKVHDLLGQGDKVSLDVRESADGSFYVPNLSKHIVESRDTLLQVVHQGSAARYTSATIMNEHSSRSHSMLTFYIERAVGPENEPDTRTIIAAKLNMVDLAGSERLSTNYQEKTGKETVNINQSLSCLANVISALTAEHGRHVPYRDSKLTRLLKDSLGGNAKTLMIACINPCESNASESMSTLRYASRAKKIKNKPKINEDPKDAILRVLREEVDTLRSVLVEKNILAFRMFQAVLDASTASASAMASPTEVIPDSPKEATSPREYPNGEAAASVISPSNLIDVASTEPHTDADHDSTTSTSPSHPPSSGPFHVDLDESESLLKNPLNHPLTQQIKQQATTTSITTTIEPMTNGHGEEDGDGDGSDEDGEKESKTSTSQRIISQQQTPMSTVHRTHTTFFTLFESSLLTLQSQLAEQLHRVQETSTADRQKELHIATLQLQIMNVQEQLRQHQLIQQEEHERMQHVMKHEQTLIREMEEMGTKHAQEMADAENSILTLKQTLHEMEQTYQQTLTSLTSTTQQLNDLRTQYTLLQSQHDALEKQHTSTITSHQQQMDALHTQLAKQQTSHHQMMTELQDQLTSLTHTSQQQQASHHTAVTTLTTQRDIAERALTTCQQSLEHATNDKNKLISSLEETKVQLTSQRIDNTMLEQKLQTEISLRKRCEDDIRRLENDNKEKQTRITTQDTECETLRNTMTEMERTITSIRHELEDEKTHVQNLQLKLKNEENERQILIQEHRTSIEEMERRERNIMDECDRLQSQWNMKQAEYLALIEEQERIKLAKEASEQDQSKLQQLMAEHSTALQKERSECIRWRTQAEQNEKQIQKMKLEWDGTKQMLEMIQQENKKLKNELTSTQSDVEIQTRTATRATHEKERIQKRIIEMEEEMKRLRVEQATATSTYDRTCQELARYKSQATEKEKQLQQIQQQVTSLQATIEQHEQKATTRMTEMDQMKREIETHVQTIAQLQADLTRLQSHCDKQQLQITDYMMKWEHAQQQVRDGLSLLEEMRLQHQKLDTEMIATQQQLQHHVDILLPQQQAMVTSLQTQLSNLEQQYNITSSELSTQQSLVQQLQRDAAQHQHDKSKLERMMSHIQRDLASLSLRLTGTEHATYVQQQLQKINDMASGQRISPESSKEVSPSESSLSSPTSTLDRHSTLITLAEQQSIITDILSQRESIWHHERDHLQQEIANLQSTIDDMARSKRDLVKSSAQELKRMRTELLFYKGFEQGGIGVAPVQAPPSTFRDSSPDKNKQCSVM